ncbi:hypothetical protein Z949_2316 [Sulfitobacter guttiformis KCTC 32187]|nr:hypothetical protein Z949_2316 [Sulfitobacter guttiformis KCTC 32187]
MILEALGETKETKKQNLCQNAIVTICETMEAPKQGQCGEIMAIVSI